MVSLGNDSHPTGVVKPVTHGTQDINIRKIGARMDVFKVINKIIKENCAWNDLQVKQPLWRISSGRKSGSRTLHMKGLTVLIII